MLVNFVSDTITYMQPDLVIVGLGNPGEKYENTRHNVGFFVLDSLVEKNGWKKSKGTNALFAWIEIAGKRAELIKPQGFYNTTGSIIGHVQKKHGLRPEQIIVVHDDVDLNFGDVRKVSGRGAGGNKGVQSVIDVLGTNTFTRIRIGIIPKNWFGKFKKPARHKIADFVLKPFSKREQTALFDVQMKAINLIGGK